MLHNLRNRIRFFLFGTVVLNPAKRIKREQKAHLKFCQKRREQAYLVEEDIFNLFLTRREVPKKEVLEFIRNTYETSEQEANDILKNWWSMEKEFLEPCMWNVDHMQIGRTLSVLAQCISEEDLDHKTWLTKKGLTMDPPSEEYRKFREWEGDGEYY